VIRKRLSLVFVLLLGVVVLLPAGVLAATPGGAFAVVDDGSRHAIAVMEWQGAGASHARLTLKASGLTPGKGLPAGGQRCELRCTESECQARVLGALHGQ